MWGIWSDVLTLWLSTSSGIFTTKLQSVAEAQVHCMKRQREMSIQQAEAQARQMRQKQTGIITPNAMQVQGIGRVPIRGNGSPGGPPGNVQVVIPPDAEWKVRRIDAWWNEQCKKTRVKKAEIVDLTG